MRSSALSARPIWSSPLATSMTGQSRRPNRSSVPGDVAAAHELDVVVAVISGNRRANRLPCMTIFSMDRVRGGYEVGRVILEFDDGPLSRAASVPESNGGPDEDSGHTAEENRRSAASHPSAGAGRCDRAGRSELRALLAAVAHAFVTGGDRPEDQPESPRRACPRGPGRRERRAADGFSIGTRVPHRPQNVGSDTVRYCGTSLPYSFSRITKSRRRSSTWTLMVPLRSARSLNVGRGGLDDRHDGRVARRCEPP